MSPSSGSKRSRQVTASNCTSLSRVLHVLLTFLPWRWRQHIPLDTSAKFYHTTRCHTPEDFPLHVNIFQWLSCSDVKSHTGRRMKWYLIASWNINFNIHVMVHIHLWTQRTMDNALSMIAILLCTFRNMDASDCDHLTAHVLHNLPTYSNSQNPEFRY
jgi:hypothetical protein